MVVYCDFDFEFGSGFEVAVGIAIEIGRASVHMVSRQGDLKDLVQIVNNLIDGNHLEIDLADKEYIAGTSRKSSSEVPYCRVSNNSGHDYPSLDDWRMGLDPDLDLEPVPYLASS
jgi:hypothetical protein